MLKFGLQLLSHFKSNQVVTILLIDRLVYFFKSDEQAKLAIEWVEHGIKDIASGDLLPHGSLSARQKYAVLPFIYSRKNVELAQKEKLLGDLMSKDKSDMAVRAQIKCRTSLPDPEIKQKEWERYNSADVKDSLVNMAASMQGFFWDNQKHETEKYANEWVDHILNYGKKHERERTEKFHDDLAPLSWIVEAGPSAIAKFKAVLEKSKDVKFLEHRLKEDYDLLVLYQRCREVYREYH